MPIDTKPIYQQALAADIRHTNFLNATEKNLAFYFFGKTVTMVKREVFPQLDILTALSSYTPEAYNPIGYLISAFVDEIANSEFKTKVSPWPVQGKEPYEAYADFLENYVKEVHRLSKRRKNIRPLTFELLTHGYFALYTDGFRYFPLTAYDFIPGDPLISDTQAQPLIVRKTKIRKIRLKNIPGVDLTKEQSPDLALVPDLEYIGLYDIWVKDLDLNVCYTQGGQEVYRQPFPYPKVYPFFAAVDTELLNSFYPIPMITRLAQLLSKYQDSIESSEESSKSIAKPLLVYDADAGIDINMVQRALKEGYKHIIIGKNREGDISFKSPGHLPGYAVQMPDKIVDQMMKHLGLTSMFLGSPVAGVRERGAVSRLIKASFRKLASKAALIEEAFSELDSYLIEYLKAHKLKATSRLKFKNVEEIFADNAYYVPEEKIQGFSSEDTYESKMFTVSKWKTKLIPQEEALEDLGHDQPRKLIERVRKEAEDNQEFAVKLRKKLEDKRPISSLDEVGNRLKGQLENRFYLTPVAEDKVLVKCHKTEAERVAFLLADLSDKVLIEAIEEKAPVPPEQKDAVVQPKEEEVPEEPKEAVQEIKGKSVVPSEEMRGETRGRPTDKLPTPEEEIKKTVSAPEKREEVSEATSPGFSEEALKNLVRISKMIPRGQTKKYLSLPGFFVAEPHAKWIFTGKKLLFVKARKFDILDQPHLLCGKQVYGVIIMRRITDDFDFKALQRYHLVSDSQKEKWWKGNKLYLYMFEFHPFERALDYTKEKGDQTFIKSVQIKSESIGMPFRGDLKPIALSPWKIPQPHKPEKKSFQPHEVFSINRLKEIIPEASYDVSSKIDGLRAFLWIHDRKARMFSDEGRPWSPNRIRPILEEAVRVFKHDVLVDGELVMKGVRRKDVAGYIHGEWKPTPEQLESLRFICWDVLYIRDKGIASLPFSKRSAVLDLYRPYKLYQKGKIQRVAHAIAKNRSAVISLAKKLMSHEGVVIRDLNASYWATHSTYKMKKMFDVDAKVFAVVKTKFGLPIFYCELRDGTYIGATYAQSEVKAKSGEVIRVNVDHVSIRPDGSVNWYGPKPRSWKEGKITPKKTSTTQVGIGGADTLDLIKEIYLITGGTEQKWNEWHPKHLIWKKEKMIKFKEDIKRKIKEGVEPAKIV